LSSIKYTLVCAFISGNYGFSQQTNHNLKGREPLVLSSCQLTTSASLAAGLLLLYCCHAVEMLLTFGVPLGLPLVMLQLAYQWLRVWRVAEETDARGRILPSKATVA